MSVRVWAKRGLHIGIFGQENTWALDDELSYTPLPPDILNSGPNEPFHEGVMSSDDKKKMVMGKLKGNFECGVLSVLSKCLGYKSRIY